MRILQEKLKKTTSTRKGRVIALSIFVLLLVAAGTAIVYWKIYRKQIIRNEIGKAIRNKTGDLYSISYDSLKLDEIAGNLSISGLKLSYDSIRYNQLLEKNDAPSTLVKITIPLLSVTGVQTPRALLDKEISGGKLIIKNPEIDIIYTFSGKDSSKNIPASKVYKQLLGGLNMIKLDTLEITGAQITTSNLKTRKKNVQFKNTSIKLVDVVLDEKTGEDPNRILFAKQLFFESEKISFPAKDRPYNYIIDSVRLNSVTNTSFIRRFRMAPLLKENAFVKSLPTQDDRFDFSINNISMQNLDIRKLLDEAVVADSILVNSASFKIYRDLSIPRDKKNRVGTYPHQVLDKLPVSVQVKKMTLSNTFVEYKEKNKITGQSGKVQFHDVSASFTNLTNNKEAIQSNNLLTADIRTKFLNKTPLNVVWKFYLQHPKGRFDLKGHLGSIAVTAVNSLTVPMGPAKMEEGQIKSLSFYFEGNNNATDGTVKMLYNDLQLSLLEKDKGSKELDRKSLGSFVANLIVKNNNPDNDKDETRVVKVHFDRDTNRSIFYLVWKSIFKGIKETVGIKQ